ncbi:MAG: amidase [Gemmataceae bacterium]
MPADPAISDDMLFATVRALGKALRQGQITSVALTEAYLDRLEKIGPRLGAVVTVTRALALRQARRADQELQAGKSRGPLHGIPYGVKDLAATQGIPTTWGAAPYRQQVFDYDAAVVEKLQDAGAVLVAKLAMVELAGGFGYNNADASFTGPGRTPWNVKFWSGGSSSGSGAAVAAGLVPFAIGTETSGSIITPSAFCGVSGLRPTFGRVSRFGVMALSWTLDKIGPMCRTADDCGLVLAALAGPDPRDETTLPVPFSHTEAAAAPNKKWRIGVIKGATESAMPEVRRNFEAALNVLAKVAEINADVALPDLPFSSAISLIVRAEAASAFRDLLDSGKAAALRNANDRWGGYTGALVLAIDYLQALRSRGPMRQALAEAYAGYDALVAPSLPTVAYPIGQDFDQAYPDYRGAGPPIIQAGNIAGQPALSVPNGFGANGLPTGIQFTGKIGDEATLIALAHAYQQATDWHQRRPKIGEQGP